jgi:hypothetical protein
MDSIFSYYETGNQQKRVAAEEARAAQQRQESVIQLGAAIVFAIIAALSPQRAAADTENALQRGPSVEWTTGSVDVKLSQK